MRILKAIVGIGLGALLSMAVLAHGITGPDQAFVINNVGAQIGPYIYLGAKHMVTGYDHLLFLAGVIFFLYRLRDVALYVTLFAVGHSTTLLIGVLGGLHVNAYIEDAIIGLSVVYKAFENLGGFRRLRQRGTERPFGPRLPPLPLVAPHWGLGRLRVVQGVHHSVVWGAAS